MISGGHRFVEVGYVAYEDDREVDRVVRLAMFDECDLLIRAAEAFHILHPCLSEARIKSIDDLGPAYVVHRYVKCEGVEPSASDYDDSDRTRDTRRLLTEM